MESYAPRHTRSECMLYMSIVYCHIPHTESLRQSPERVARFLKSLAKVRQLDTVSYASSVAARRKRRPKKDVPIALAPCCKALNRTAKRRISKLEKQCNRLRGANKDLRSQVRVVSQTHMHTLVCIVCTVACMQNKRLQKENVALKRTIAELRSGDHDITLAGVSQSDMETILTDVSKDPTLGQHLSQHDPSGTLKAFWEEQVARSQCGNKRKQWNPVVLRFMLHLWERMGEKKFRLLSDEKVTLTLHPNNW